MTSVIIDVSATNMTTPVTDTTADFITSESTCWSNDTSKNDSTPFIYGTLEASLGGSFSMIFSLVGFTFNLLIIASVMYHRKTREQTLTPFIISLSSSDLIFSIATLPFFAIRFFSRYILQWLWYLLHVGLRQFS